MTDTPSQQYGQVIKLTSQLPGDAMDVLQPQEELLDNPVPSTSMIDPPVAALVSSVITLTSISSDGQRTRQFHAKYYKPVESDAPLRAVLDLPEQYYTPTASELQTAFAGQVRKREQLTEAPLMTKKLREREEAEKSREKQKRWPQTRIRVRFADRSQLEGVFPSTDKLVHVYEFVRLALAQQYRDKPFVLYQTPPRREYMKGDPQFKGKTLMDLQLTPSSVFYIKFADDDLDSPASRPPLVEELLQAAADFPLQKPVDPSASDTSSSGNAKSKPLTSQKLGFGGASGTVTPKWMKFGKK